MTMRAACILALLGLLAIGSTPAAASGDGGERVLRRIILIRHGIRSPTKAPADLAKFAAEPWPAWPVAPGQLTPHGIDTLRSLGRRMAKDLTAAGLPANACTDGVSVIADSTPRNRASAGALLEGFSPACTATYRAFPPGQDDPLFRGTGAGDDEDKAGIDAASVDNATRATLAELQRVLLGCQDEACLADATTRGKQVLLDGDVARSLKTAGSLAENIMLAYVQGMPAQAFGWDRVDAAGMARIIGLHNASFRLAHATPQASRGRGGNMLAHITATLSSAAGETTAAEPLAGAKTRVLILIGHDTDLAAQAGLLGLGWHDATHADDFPPGGALIYDLVQTHAGKAVRVSIAMPTLEALRKGDMAPASAIVSAPLPQPACHGTTACPLPDFIHAATAAVGDAFTTRAPSEPDAKGHAP